MRMPQDYPEFPETGKKILRAKARRAIEGGHEAYGHMSDEWVADRVRMLMRNDLEHEAICVASRDRIMRLSLEIERLNALINTPHTHDFLEAVKLEMPHQRERWGTEHDGGKTPADWFWLVGHLAGKAVHAFYTGNTDKAKHHVITTGAALGNWFLAITGENTSMRPGIEP